MFLNGGQLLEVSEIEFLEICQVLKSETFWLLGQVRSEQYLTKVNVSRSANTYLGGWGSSADTQSRC